MRHVGEQVDDIGHNALLFDAATELLEKRDRRVPTLLFLGVPLIDKLGHRFERDSVQFAAGLIALDRALSKFLSEQRGPDVKFIVTADHGCRKVTECVSLSLDGSYLECWSAGGTKCDRKTLPIRDIAKDQEGRPAIVLDGGTIRIWANDPASSRRIANHVRGELGSQLRKVFLVTGSRRHRCSHEHWGQVVGIARRHVALCKRVWLFRDDCESPTNMVVGEHGTNWTDDAVVPWWGEGESHVDALGGAFVHLLENAALTPG